MITRGLVPNCLDGIAERMVCAAERLHDDRAALRLLRRASQVNTMADRLRHRGLRRVPVHQARLSIELVAAG